MVYEHSFTNLQHARFNFEDDRFLLKKANAHPRKRTKAFLTEVHELNGPDKEGYFGLEAVEIHPERENDYRQQEVADIVLIGLGLSELFRVELNEAKIYEEAARLAKGLHIPVVTETQNLELAKVFSRAEEDKYEALKRQLNRAVADVTFNNLQKGEKAQKTIERVIALCFVIFYLMGLPPIKACFEKISRNMLKYLATDYQSESGTYTVQEKRSKNTFDGPKDKVTGHRPQWGTIEFYGFYEQAQVIYDRQKAQPQKIAAPWRVIGSVVAKLYGQLAA